MTRKITDHGIRIVHRLSRERAEQTVCGVDVRGLLPGHVVSSEASELDRCLTCETVELRGMAR
jgi:hypothetical protein